MTRDNLIVKLIFGACFAILACCLVVVGWATYQTVFNRDEWKCEETGRLTSGVRIIGKVIIPYTNEPEIKCTRIEK